jgi:NADH-quinone oxidoreductase subunit F
MLEILDRICTGLGTSDDLPLLERLARVVGETSLCGLGQTAPNPVVTTLRYFRDEYEEHIERKHCRAGACAGLVTAPCSHLCPAGGGGPALRPAGGRAVRGRLSRRSRTLPLPSVCGAVCFHPASWPGCAATWTSGSPSAR